MYIVCYISLSFVNNKADSTENAKIPFFSQECWVLDTLPVEEIMLGRDSP
jgi:hypothetical protein